MPSPPLPIDPWLPRIASELAAAGTLVLAAEPGAGKTTRVPPYLAGLSRDFAPPGRDPGGARDLSSVGTGGVGNFGSGGPGGNRPTAGDLAPPPVDGEVWVLGPRRIAARSAAQRVASEVGCAVGEAVGYQVRFEKRISPATRLRFVTEGILTRRLLADPMLEGITTLVFDEFHERSLEADLGLALAREVQTTVRPDLRIVVMSATLETEAIAAYLGRPHGGPEGSSADGPGSHAPSTEAAPAASGSAAPILTVPGRSFPIEIDHLEHPEPPPLPVGVRLAFEHLVDDGLTGSVLVFVPGAAEIRACLRELEPALRTARYVGVALHGDLPVDEQDRAIRSRERRVVVSTNLAEASVTVEGIEAVIDSGRVRVARFDPWVGLDRLRTERIPQASAVQRAGRAGRLGPGRCVRLYGEDELARWAPYAEPEIRRVDLSATVLALRGWGTRNLGNVAWPTTPLPEALLRAEQLLAWLGAVDASGQITALGRAMLRFPVPPRHARVLVEAERLGVGRRAARWVALAGERDPRRPEDRPRRSDGPSHGRPERAHGKVAKIERAARPTGAGAAARGAGAAGGSGGAAVGGSSGGSAGVGAWRPTGEAESDLAVLEEKVGTVAAAHFSHDVLVREGLDGRTVRRIVDVAGQLERLVERGGRDVANDSGHDANDTAPADATDRLRRAILAGHPDRVVRRHGSGAGSGVMVGGAGVRLDPSSSVRRAEFFVALDATGRDTRPGEAARTEIRVWTASSIEPEWLREVFPGSWTEQEEVVFLESKERVRAARVTRFLDLVIAERETGEAAPEAISAALVRAASLDPGRALGADRELEELLLRLETLARHLPELGIVPREELLASVLPFLADGCRSLADLRRKPVRESLLGLLPAPVRKALAEDAPDRLTLPSGQSFRVRYDGEVPVLAVRLQELFGGSTAPRLGSGRIPLLLHLLAPSQRPVQITQDLDGFWDREYPKIRSELRRRYPKHAWPEDPRSAAPSRPGKKR